MSLPAAAIRWLAGWVEFTRRAAVPGYAARGPLARLGLDLAVLAIALGRASTAFAALAALAAGLAALVLAWRLDLAGWRRDAVLCLPVLLVAPWVAAGRRRHLEALLARRPAPPATSVTDRGAAPRETPAPQPRERTWPWRQRRQAMTAAARERVLASSRRWRPRWSWCWWRRWRSRNCTTRLP